MFKEKSIVKYGMCNFNLLQASIAFSCLISKTVAYSDTPMWSNTEASLGQNEKSCQTKKEFACNKGLYYKNKAFT